MKLGPRYKIAKRLGAQIFEKTQTQRFLLSQQRSAKNKKGRRGGGSDYSRQLIEKQKLRLTYGLTESQFSSYVKKALGSTGNPQSVLFQLLETRLDAIAYRMGLVPTRRAGRQLVSHGHLVVNGKRVTTPSFQVSPGQIITIREGSRDSGLFALVMEKLKEHHAPSWVVFNPDTKEGTLVNMPVFLEHDAAADIGAVFEYYTR